MSEYLIVARFLQQPITSLNQRMRRGIWETPADMSFFETNAASCVQVKNMIGTSHDEYTMSMTQCSI